MPLPQPVPVTTPSNPCALVRAALARLIGGDAVPVRTLNADGHQAVVIDERLLFEPAQVRTVTHQGLGMRASASVEVAAGWRVSRLVPGPVCGYRETRPGPSWQEIGVSRDAAEALGLLIAELVVAR